MPTDTLRAGINFQSIFETQRKKGAQIRREPIGKRKEIIRAWGDFLLKNKDRIREAVHADFGKPHVEVDISELYPVMTEIRHALEHLSDWTQPVKIDAPLTFLGSRSEVRYEPKGVCLILSPWNFPFNLCFGPLISCLAAGNTAIIKPSELTPNTSQLMADLVKEFFEEDLVTVIQGGPEISQQLLTLPFDHIFFTGSPAIGKVVMRAAAEHLSSVTLELGGKSPTIIDASASIADAARRVAFGKFLNNGQTCIAPDYVLIDERVKDKFIEALKENVTKLFGEGHQISEKSTSYARIINQKHFQRVTRLIEDAIQKGAKVEFSGEVNKETNFMHPVILSDISPDSLIMEEEIFGPVLPILTFRNDEEVIELVNNKPKPLALYIFSHSKSFQEKILQQTSAGTACVNECVLQFTHPNLPFGGVNNSGIGKSHGYSGFLAFSNEKPVLRQKRGWAIPYVLHPPYTERMKKMVALMLRWF